MAATPETVKLFLGPIYVGTILSTCLFGLSMSQFTTYFLSARRLQDPLSIRILVLWQLLIGTFSSATSVYFVWLYLVDNYFNPGFIALAPWPLAAVPLLSVLFVEGSQLTPLADSWLAITVANDLAVTYGPRYSLRTVEQTILNARLSLMFYLHRKRTGFPKTDTVIHCLIRSALESAAFATFFSTVSPKTGFHLMFSQPMGRIYTCTLLSTLNARQALRDGMHGIYEFGESDADVDRFNLRPRSQPHRDPLSVKITVENVTDGHRFDRGSMFTKPAGSVA
ncbi:hypothetical protein B0H14DRAFT_2592632 [Mycena olivaceomarginata]|nr:hypothetical protein B0H14DRAFT_2592632 [Mycena olivaceomarginata]